MRKVLILASLVVVFLGFSIAPAGAWTYVYDNGDTGNWRTYTYTNNTGSTINAYAGFMVSNAPDNSFDSQLFIDNLSQAALGNKGFETGNFTGYLLSGVGTVATSYSDWGSTRTIYPAEGSYFAALNDPNVSGGRVNTNLFTNAFGQAGTQGTILTTAISLAPGQSFSFQWIFGADDYASLGATDFSKFFLAGNADGTNIIFQDGLGQLATVPLPPAILLLGSGLLGLMAFRQKIKVK